MVVFIRICLCFGWKVGIFVSYDEIVAKEYDIKIFSNRLLKKDKENECVKALEAVGMHVTLSFSVHNFE